MDVIAALIPTEYSPVPNPLHPYFVWEEGYKAALADMRRGADGSPGGEFTGNPHANLGQQEES